VREIKYLFRVIVDNTKKTLHCFQIILKIMIIFIIIISTTACMQGIYYYVPERNHVPRVDNVASVL